jgi:integrase
MQRGQIKRIGNCWMLRYWGLVTDDTGQMVKRRFAKKLATYGDQFRTEASVRPLAEEILAPLNARTARPESTQTVADFLERVYLPHCRETLRPSTCKSYTDLFKLVQPHLDNITLRQFRTPEAHRLMRDVAEEKQRAHTTHRALKSFLSGAFKFAKQSGAVAENPIRDAAIPRGKPAGKTHAYSLEEIQAMLAVLSEPTRTLVLVTALTGLRISEIKGLKWEDFDGNQLSVSRSVWQGTVSETKTLVSHATVPVLDIVAQALAEHRERNGEGPYVFHGQTGQPLRLENILRRDILPVFERAGIEWHGWHAFRRGLATNLYALGAPDKTVQAILRHANVATTMAYYVKPVAAESVAAMKKLERAFTKSSVGRARLA